MDEVRAHLGIYNLLAALFQGAPDETAVALLQTEPVLAALEGLFADDAASQPVLRQLRTAEASQLAERLTVDYTMLFCAPGATQVPPHESVFRDKLEISIPPQPDIDYVGDVRTFEGLYWGDSTVAVAHEYQTEGFDPGDAIPDSLSLELAFMAHLCERELAYAEAGNVAAADARAYRQNKFLKEHLLQWAPTFTEKVRKARPGSFYAMAALLMLRFLEAEAEVEG
jgi:putative dimethyl sulfoxide reductase chaperone